MTENEIAAIERACQRLIVSYCLMSDGRQHEALAALWAEDGTWDSAIGPLKGRADVRRYLDGKTVGPVTRHISSNAQIDVIDENHAKGTSYFTVYRADKQAEKGPNPLAGPALVGQYFDEYVRTREGWKFAHRRMEFTFRAV